MKRKTRVVTEKRWVILRDGKRWLTARGTWPLRDVRRIWPQTEGFVVLRGTLTYEVPDAR